MRWRLWLASWPRRVPSQSRNPPPPTLPRAQREYWRERERRDGPPLVVEYGNDVDGSLFLEQDRLGASRWNLNVRRGSGLGVGHGFGWCACSTGQEVGGLEQHEKGRCASRAVALPSVASTRAATVRPARLQSLPLEPGSALRHCGRPIAGVSTPMLYVGQLFSTL